MENVEEMNASNHQFLAITQPDISDLTIRLKNALDEEWTQIPVPSNADSITPKILEEIIKQILLLFSNEDLNLVKAISFHMLKEKLSTVLIQDEGEVQKALYTNLVHAIKLNQLPELYLTMAEAMASFQRLLAPMFVGEDSEANENRKKREAFRKEQVNKWVSADDELIFGNLKKYLAFLARIHTGTPLTQESLKAFKLDLTSGAIDPFAFEKGDSLGKRQFKYHASTVFFDDIDNQPGVTKEARKEVQVLFDLLQASEDPSPEVLQSTKDLLLKQHEAQLAREEKQIPVVLNDLFLQKITFQKAMVQLIERINEPIESIYKNNNLNPVEKIGGIIGLGVTKSLEALFDLIMFAIKAHLRLAYYAITKPFEASEKFGRMLFNVLEVLYFFARALNSKFNSEDSKYKDYMALSQKKCMNLAYNARKGLEAALISIAVGFVIFANLAVYGGITFTHAGIHALTAAHTLEAIKVTDEAQIGQEYLIALMGIAAASISTAEKHDRETRLALVKEQMEKLTSEKELVDWEHVGGLVKGDLAEAKKRADPYDPNRAKPSVPEGSVEDIENAIRMKEENDALKKKLKGGEEEKDDQVDSP